MPNISAWPNGATVCFLSQVLETGLIPQKYFLSSTARRDSAPRYKYGSTEHPARPEKVPFDMLGFGQYGGGITASTCKARDYKDATDLVIDGGKVRRTTPIEVERVMGFPDDYTQIEWRGKPAEECPDGHRYKALGNSMAVPCMAWIGKKHTEVLSVLSSSNVSIKQLFSTHNSAMSIA